jgi:hypothetical protein
MRKAFIVSCVVLALTGGTAASAGNGGGSATGGAHLTVHDVFGLGTLELQTFSFNARTGADGTADGWFTYHEVDDGASFTADGAVTCLTVIGNDAWIGGVIQRSNDATYDGLGAWWHVTDNGQGAHSAPDVTTFMGAGSLDDTRSFCDTHPAYRHPFPIDNGNIQVQS